MDTTTDWITAAATGFAAIGTVGALVFAARAARAATKTANEVRRAIEAEARPLLIDVPYELMGHEREVPLPRPARRRPRRPRGPVSDAE